MFVANPSIAPPYCLFSTGQSSYDTDSRSKIMEIATNSTRKSLGTRPPLGTTDVFESPYDAVPLGSPFYITRSPIEEQACTTLAQPGGLVRIRAAKGLGKSSLLLRIAAFAQEKQYRIVHLDGQALDPHCYEDGDRFLRWLCAAISHQLKLENKLDQYWDEDIGSKLSCTAYLDEYILDTIQQPLLLMIGNINELLNHPQIARIFFPMLRFWHEQTKYSDRFQALRVLLSGATESYVELDVHQSPFNVGLTLQLQPFTQEEVHELALRHGLDWTFFGQSAQLTHLTGGNPYLVRLALDYFCHTGQRGQEPEAIATTLNEAGLYDKHLRGCYAQLQQHPELVQIMKTLVTLAPGEGLDILSIHSHHLHNLGLVTIKGDRVFPACELYRSYFRQQFQLTTPSALAELRAENQHLRNLIYQDDLTGIRNRRYFDKMLISLWQQMGRAGEALGLILVDIDHFKQYNDTYGHQQGDRCLHAVAQAIHSAVTKGIEERMALDRRQNTALSQYQRPNDSPPVVARYGGEEFAILLPYHSPLHAKAIGDLIRTAIHQLKIEHRTSSLPCQHVTVSMGIASRIPIVSHAPSNLVMVADHVLYQSKHAGRGRYTLYLAS